MDVDISKKRKRKAENAHDEIGGKKIAKTNEYYPKSGLANVLHGINYQQLLLMLFSKRGNDLGYEYKMATEWAEAAKFDDVVFSYVSNGKKIFRFLQAKHKQDAKLIISAANLLNETDDDFSLLKYFQSFCEIKKNNCEFGGARVELKDFTICTNIGFNFRSKKVGHFDLKKDIFEDLSVDDEILKTRFCRFKKDFDGKDHFLSVLKHSSELNQLASALVKCVLKIKRNPHADALTTYQYALAEEIIDVDTQKFKTNFIRPVNLSPNAENFQKTFIEEFQLQQNQNLKRKFDFDIDVISLPNNNFGQIIDTPLPDKLLKSFITLLKKWKLDQKMAVKINEKSFGKDFFVAFCKYGLKKKLNENEFAFSLNFIINDSSLPPALKKLRIDIDTAFKNEMKDVRDWEIFKFNVKNMPKFVLPELDFCVSDAEEFLEKLTFAVNQPNEENLAKILEKELREKFNLKTQSEISFSIFYQRMFKWFEAKSGTFLTNRDYDEMMRCIKRALLSVEIIGVSNNFRSDLKKLNFNFNFENEALKKIEDFLSSGNQLLNVINANNLKLSSIKVNQVLTADAKFQADDSVIFVDHSTVLNYAQQIIEIFGDTEHFSLLVVECESLDDITLNFFIKSILFNKQPLKQVILLTLKNDSRRAELCEIFENSSVKNDEHFDENNNFQNLNSSTRTQLLNRELEFQGMSVTFMKVVEHIIIDDLRLLSDVINSEIITALIIEGRPKRILVGEKLSTNKFYVNRKLFRKTVLKNQCLNDGKGEIYAIKCDANNYSYLANFPPNSPVKMYIGMTNNEFERMYTQKPDQADHWLEINDEGQLVWKYSTKSVSNLRQYFDHSYLTEMEIEDFLAVEDKKISIISADPGMGKTTTLTQMAINTKQSCKEKWIIRINVNSHTDQLVIGQFNELHSVRTFLSKALNLESNLEKNLFDSYFAAPEKIIVVFDGLDEVAPFYHEIVLTMAELLIQTNASVWLSTRPFLKNNVEDKFCTFSYGLIPFAEKDQIDFFGKYWMKMGKFKATDEFIRALINLMNNSLKDNEKEFLGVPLHTEMIADIYLEEARASAIEKLPKKYNMLGLFDDFFRIKYERYCVEKKMQVITNAQNMFDDEDIKNLNIRHHRLMSLFQLYERTTIEKEILEESAVMEADALMTEMAKGKNNLGIISEIKNQKPIFIHRTFVEYFAAGYFSANCTLKRIKTFLRTNLFLRENQVLRNFFDRQMTKSSAFLSAVLDEDFDRVRELKNHPQLSVELDKGGRSAVHLAAAHRYTSICKELLIVDGLAIEFINKADELFNWSPLQYADNEARWETAEILLNHGADANHMINLKEIISKDIIRGNTLLHLSAEKGLLQLARVIIDHKPDLVNVQNRDDLEKTPLHLASKFGHLDMVELLLENGANVMSEDHEKNTPLHLAAAANCKEVLSLLLQKNRNAGVDPQNMHQQTPFYLAVANGSLETVQLLINAKANVNTRSAISPGLAASDWTPLHVGACYDYLEIVRLLLDNGADKNAEDSLSRTPLDVIIRRGDVWSKLELVKLLGGSELHEFHLAIGCGRLDRVEDMLKNKNETEVKAMLTSELKRGGTALQKAAYNGHLAVVEFICEKGIDINEKSSDNGTPLHEAIYGGRVQIARFLIEKGADVTAVNNDQWSILHAAAQYGQLEIFKLVQNKLDRAFDMHTVDGNGTTYLGTAAYHNQLAVVKYLVENGAPINLGENLGVTPLILSLVRNYQSIARYLIGLPNINLNGEEGKFLGNIGISAMHFASAYDNVELMSLMVEEHGADVNVGKGIGVTPLHIAALLDNHKTIEFLLSKNADKAVLVNTSNLFRHIIETLDKLPPIFGAFDMNKLNSSCKLFVSRPVQVIISYVAIDAYFLTTLLGYNNHLLEREESIFSKFMRNSLMKMLDIKKYADLAKSLIIQRYK